MSDISNGLWETVDGDNDAASPDGWTSGVMLPNQVEPTARAMMGGVKRWWERCTPTLSTTGTSPTYVITPTNTLYPTAYTQGEIYAAKASFTSLGNEKLGVNGLANKNIYVYSSSGASRLAAGQIVIGQPCIWVYDSALNSGNGGMVLVNPASTATTSAPVILVSGNVTHAQNFLALDLSSYTGYNRIEVDVDNVILSGGSGAPTIRAAVSTNAGSTYLSANYGWSKTEFTSSYVWDNDTSDSFIYLADGTALTGFSFRANLYAINTASVFVMDADVTQYQNGSTLAAKSNGMNSATSVNAIRFSLASGTASTGTYRVIGYR